MYHFIVSIVRHLETHLYSVISRSEAKTFKWCISYDNTVTQRLTRLGGVDELKTAFFVNRFLHAGENQQQGGSEVWGMHRIWKQSCKVCLQWITQLVKKAQHWNYLEKKKKKQSFVIKMKCREQKKNIYGGYKNVKLLRE